MWLSPPKAAGRVLQERGSAADGLITAPSGEVAEIAVASFDTGLSGP
jgi:hypothetical protein